MERAEIIKKFLEAGYQLDREVLDYFSQEPQKISPLLAVLDTLSPRPITVTMSTLEKISPLQATITVTRVFEEGRKPKKVQEVVNYLNSRYQRISGLLQNRSDLANLVSIRKITDKMKKLSIICLIKDLDEDQLSAVVEDTTGELNVFFSERESFSELVLDEVVGLTGINDNGRFSIANVIRPDIPLKKEVAHADRKIGCYFISGLFLDAKGFAEEKYEKLVKMIADDTTAKVVVLLGGIAKTKERIEKFFGDLPSDSVKIYLKTSAEPEVSGKNVVVVSDPTIVNIGKVSIFLSHGDILRGYFQKMGKPPAEALLALVKKRHLDPTFNHTKKIYDQDPYFLDTVPDIFCLGYFSPPGVLNYKGSTILVTGNLLENPIYWKVDLETRENIKIDLT